MDRHKELDFITLMKIPRLVQPVNYNIDELKAQIF